MIPELTDPRWVPALRPPGSRGWQAGDLARVARELAARGVRRVELAQQDVMDGEGAPDEAALVAIVPSLRDNDLQVAVGSADLSTSPVFAEGALTSPHKGVRRHALAKVLRFADLSAAMGTETLLLHEPRGSGWGRDPFADVQRLREGVEAVSHYLMEQGFSLRLALLTGPGAHLRTAGEGMALATEVDSPSHSPRVVASGTDLSGAAWAWERQSLVGITFGQPSDDLQSFRLVDLLEHGSLTGQRKFPGDILPRPPVPDVPPEEYVAALDGVRRRYERLAQLSVELRADPGIVSAMAAAGVLESVDCTLHPGETPAQLSNASDTVAPLNLPDQQRLRALIAKGIADGPDASRNAGER